MARKGAVLAVGHVERFNPAVSAAAPYVTDPKYITATRAGAYTFRSIDVSVVLDLMIHDIDLVLELAGAPVVRLAAAGGRSAEGPIDYVNATLAFAVGESPGFGCRSPDGRARVACGAIYRYDGEGRVSAIDSHRAAEPTTSYDPENSGSKRT